jgi:hypothetical protein
MTARQTAEKPPLNESGCNSWADSREWPASERLETSDWAALRHLIAAALEEMEREIERLSTLAQKNNADAKRYLDALTLDTRNKVTSETVLRNQLDEAVRLLEESLIPNVAIADKRREFLARVKGGKS